MNDVTNESVSDRNRRWAATMEGYEGGATTTSPLPTSDSTASIDRRALNERPAPRHASPEREEQLEPLLAPGATRSTAPATRAREEEPDEFRTCFERDRDRILHSSAFRRLAGKTQVFVFPDDHMRTRLTHALEVAQVATGVARAVRAQRRADRGHRPRPRLRTRARRPRQRGGARPLRRRAASTTPPWGADVSLRLLNLCVETLDGIRNHSWSRPGPRDTRRRGRELGRPHRLRLPRLRGRRVRAAS